MRILLIRPPVPRHTIGLKHVMVCEPLELEYLAAALTEHDVRILDLILERGLKRELRKFQPELVATSCYITGVNEVLKICKLAKRHNAACFTAVGGVHASVMPEDFADPAVDCIALGDGTALMPMIVEAAQGQRSLQSIPNLAIPSGPGKVHKTAAAPYLSHPDQLPLPRRDLTAHIRHKYYYLFHQPVATVKTTWGCWYSCNFCMTWAVTGGQVFSRSPQSIVDEIATLAENDVYIVDDIFLIKPVRLQEIARLLRERGIRKNFLVYGRADFIADHEEIISEWSRIGLSAVIVGLEAGTDSELLDFEKRCTLEQNQRAIEVLRRNGVDLYASLIPRPDYEPDDWNRLSEFIEENKIYYVNISPLTPLPGSPIWSAYKNQITVARNAYDLWDLSHCVLPTRLPLKQYYRQLLKLYARTVLNIRRANRITLRTRPPIWSAKYLRLWLGAAKIFFQFISAYRHHSPKEITAAQYSGPATGINRYRWDEEYQADRTDKSADETSSFRNSARLSDSDFNPVNPFDGFIDSKGQLRPDAYDGLLDISPAHLWFDIFSWSMPDRLYTYQQPFAGMVGPKCKLNGREYKMLSSYDYLGLIGNPEIEEAAIAAIKRYGAGTGGVRLLTGTTQLHQELESEIAHLKGVEAAISFSSGYLANVSCITALMGPGDLVILDSRAHRSIRDACRLARVPIQIFPHNDCAALENFLRVRDSTKRTLVITEGVFSMDGDFCPLPDLIALKQQYGAYLMVDEAHSVGVIGDTGRGIDEHFGVPAKSVDIWMGTFSKAFGSTGGYIAGSRSMITYLQHAAAPFMFSAACSPPTVAAALKAIQILQREPERVQKVAKNASIIRTRLSDAHFDIGDSKSHIIPVILGADEAAWRFSRLLFGKGIIALAVVPPAVSRGRARLRLCATAAQDPDFLDETLQELVQTAKVERHSYTN